MRAVVLSGADEADAEIAVDTEAGRLVGTWRGSGPVRAGDVVDIELELVRPRTWSEMSAGGASEVRPPGAAPVQGVVVMTHDDGVLVVRVGSAMVQLELLGDPPAEAIGQTLSIPADDLEIYPTGT